MIRSRRAPKGPDPWELVWGQPYIDTATLAQALEADLRRTSAPDFRTRLLVRDAARAIRSFWGMVRFTLWLAASPVGDRVRAILEEDLGRPGFRHIRSRLVSSIGLTDLKQVLDQEKARRRLLHDGKAFLDDPNLRPQIEESWRFIYQEPLFPPEVPKPSRKRKRPGGGDAP